MAVGLKGFNVLLGVTGGIAAYKALELLRLLVKEGARVFTIMTRAAAEFVGPLSFQALSGQAVRTEMFSPSQEGQVQHIALADMAQVAVVAPATANILAKMAHGLADDLLSTTLLAVRCPVVVCPAMNVNMYHHPATQGNLRILRERGVWIVEPEEGELACGWEGKGRLAEPDSILETLKCAVSPQDLSGEHVLVTAGPTFEALDPVRFLGNRSSGKMGYAIARVAKRRGAEVTLVSGPVALKPPRGVNLVSVESAAHMRDAVMAHLDRATVVIKAAAVADYMPKEAQPEKIKKSRGPWSLSLVSTPDILAEVGSKKGSRVLVGFAAETSRLIHQAREKLERKNLDWIVANDVTKAGSGFGADTNQVTILGRDGSVEELPQMSKEDVAWAVLDRVLRSRGRGSGGEGQ
ncbi:MAG: bifunctional phosphopantothenoylcysteine decarboxylase/phosphopantothenate--cysteine ligase CoaBC [Thermodesulfobacteriota bacterium]